MKVKIIRTTFVKGELAKAGETISVSDEDGKYLIALKKAVAASAKAEKAESAKAKKAEKAVKE